MTKMAAMLKTLKNLLLQSHGANCLETWYVASGSVVLQILYKGDPGFARPIYGKVSFGSLDI